jgi:hypothetical protein
VYYLHLLISDPFSIKVYHKKGKAVPVLLYSAHLEDVWGSEVIAPPFSTCTLDAGDLAASCPCHFTPGTY